MLEVMVIIKTGVIMITTGALLKIILTMLIDLILKMEFQHPGIKELLEEVYIYAP